ncbi:LamB/YcsF family protein [Aquimixticola soesokkakensis]|uniref:5-oxoprolinase subunit A n=1 Tax=Aquimixticola soesokkakensis TaxID=1519096 RepID=A0A1Y5SXV6_9RHOB|nr:5-oxoprolinase subunit PxpA [Aquimixticola soesokkakensis]SLN51135.1 LamB/YcsF family protein [Aquimixticola soesokkakensis]
MARRLDLNCDMGESFGAWGMGEDAAMLDIVTSANIACGFHAGDPMVMRDTIKAAKTRGVAIGAHPGFNDLAGFGRRRISGDSPEDLTAQLIYQIAAMQGMARAFGHDMTHVKPHGALMNMACEDKAIAQACVAAIRAIDPTLIFVTLPYSVAFDVAQKAGLRVACEIYADRSYGARGQLTPRSHSGAVIHDPAQSRDQVLEMVVGGMIPTTQGTRLPVEAATLCVHGDNPQAVEIARTLRAALASEGVRFAPLRAD